MRLGSILMAGVLAAGLAACTARVEEEGKAPDVDVNVDPGTMPQVDVDPATVEVSSDTQQVVTPDVDIVPAGDSAH